jgi:hypothetical protein
MRYKWPYAQLHDYVLFVANTGLRPDEAPRLKFRDVEVVSDDATDETILHIEVRGKRGVGYCKSTTGAVRPFERLKERERVKADPDKPGSMKTVKPTPTDRLFPYQTRRNFRGLNMMGNQISPTSASPA